MPSHTERKFLPYTPPQVFSLVADVERYPEFLPWVSAVRIRERKDSEIRADLIASFGALKETFTSHVILRRPRATKDAGEIHVELVEGPFHFLENQWRFLPHEEGTIVDFTITFRFRSKVLEKLAGFMFHHALTTMVSAFEKRAEALYRPPLKY